MRQCRVAGCKSALGDRRKLWHGWNFCPEHTKRFRKLTEELYLRLPPAEKKVLDCVLARHRALMAHRVLDGYDAQLAIACNELDEIAKAIRRVDLEVQRSSKITTPWLSTLQRKGIE